MLAFAVSECGLTADQFFSLSWYEWSLEVHKVAVSRKRDIERWELDALLARDMMALTYNLAGKTTKKNLEGKDFIKLSFDEVKKEVEHVRMSPEEVERRFGKTLKEKIKDG